MDVDVDVDVDVCVCVEVWTLFSLSCCLCLSVSLCLCLCLSVSLCLCLSLSVCLSSKSKAQQKWVGCGMCVSMEQRKKKRGKIRNCASHQRKTAVNYSGLLFSHKPTHLPLDCLLFSSLLSVVAVLVSVWASEQERKGSAPLVLVLLHVAWDRRGVPSPACRQLRCCVACDFFNFVSFIHFGSHNSSVFAGVLFMLLFKLLLLQPFHPCLCCLFKSLAQVELLHSHKSTCTHAHARMHAVW